MKKRKYNFILISSFVIFLAIFLFFLLSFFAGDACMDSGGRWQYLSWNCERGNAG
jgi:hypothetical protein